MSEKKSSAIELKKQEVEDIKAKLEKAQSVVLIDYRGATVAEDTALRREFRKANVEYKVLKNTLVKRALNAMSITDLDNILEGPTAVAFGYDDIISPAKIIVNNITSIKKMSVKGGLVEGKPVSVDEIKTLATIPDKNTLVAMLLSMLTAPVRSLAVAMDQIAQKG